jgi:hypothetical protein
MNEKIYGYNISEQHKCFLWSPAKTGSMHVEFILTHFDFHFENSNYKRDIVKNYQDFPKHNHDCMLFEGHEDYKLIMTVRNPYSRVLSQYLHGLSIQNLAIETSSNFEDFTLFVEKLYPMSSSQLNNGFSLSTRVPDYSIRIENLYEDYLKIPFIKESKLNYTGLLLDLCNKKIHENSQKLISYKGYFNQRISDLIYYNMVKYFDLFGYSKNSWKEII